MAKATKMAIADRLNTTEGRVGKGVDVCVCVREGSPRPPRGPRWHHPTLTVKGGGSRDIKALPSYFLLEGCFEKGRRIEWQGSWVKRGKNICSLAWRYAKERTDRVYKETWKRRKFRAGKDTKRASIWIYICAFLYKNLRSSVEKLLPVQITLTLLVRN